MCPMKLPRWLVIAMLTTSVLSVLAAAGWCWVTWPERTAREFLDLMRENRRDDAKAMMVPIHRRHKIMLDSMTELWAWHDVRIRFMPRDISDVVRGRQTIYLCCPAYRHDYEFIVTRGRVGGRAGWVEIDCQEKSEP